MNIRIVPIKNHPQYVNLIRYKGGRDAQRLLDAVNGGMSYEQYDEFIKKIDYPVVLKAINESLGRDGDEWLRDFAEIVYLLKKCGVIPEE